MTGPAARKSFGSDNHAGTHPAVMRAIVEANAGDAVGVRRRPMDSAGDRRAPPARRAREGEVYLVLNGSGANVLGLGLLLGRHEAVICAESAHINTDECGAAERILGTKLLTVPAPDGKLTPELIAARLAGRGDEHFAQPGVVAITQSTEFGTCYSLDELRAIKEFCAANGLRVYLDGARLANAAAHLGCSPGRPWRPARTCSASAAPRTARWASRPSSSCEPATRPTPRYLRKQHMQLSSKMRFLGAQFSALLTDDLWLRNAAHANAMATRLAAGLAEIPGRRSVYPVQSDAVFARLDPGHIAALQRDWMFYVWDESASVVRWMTAFDTTESDVDAFLSDIAATPGPPGLAPDSRQAWFHVKQPAVAGPGRVIVSRETRLGEAAQSDAPVAVTLERTAAARDTLTMPRAVSAAHIGTYTGDAVAQQRRGLGKGLGALIPEAPAPGRRGTAIRLTRPSAPRARGAIGSDGVPAATPATADSDRRRRPGLRQVAGAYFEEVAVGVDRAQPPPAPPHLRRGRPRRAGRLHHRGRPAAAGRGPQARRRQLRARHGRAPLARVPASGP